MGLAVLDVQLDPLLTPLHVALAQTLIVEIASEMALKSNV